MLGHLGVNTFRSVQTVGITNGASGFGVVVIPGASDAEGSWTSWAVATDEVYAIYLAAMFGATANQIKRHFLDIGVDVTGGTSYTPIISNIGVSAAGTSTAGPRQLYFPLRLPAGTRIGLRLQGSNATVGSQSIYGCIYSKPSRPDLLYSGSTSETLGVTSGTIRTTIVPGTNAMGSWVSLGSTTKTLCYWQVFLSLETTTVGSRWYGIELAYGDGTNYRTIIKNANVMTIQPQQTQPLTPGMGYCVVPAGSTIYARAWATSAPVTTTVLATGLGA